MNHRLSSRIETIDREQRRRDAAALQAMSDEELAALIAEGTRYTAEQMFAFSADEWRAFLTEQGNAWVLDLSDDEIDRLLAAP
jgi:hypothetical protein